MVESEKRPNPNPLWSFFSSIRLTLTILIVLAVASVAGTLIPQREEAVRIAHDWSPGLINLFQTLQLFDIYHSLWFRLIIAALALNLTVCSLDRFPRTWKRYRGQEKIDKTNIFEGIPANRTFSAGGRREEVMERVAEVIKKHFRRVEHKETDHANYLFSEKGRYAYLGVYLVHLSVLLILVGGILGSLLGFEAYVNIPEGGVTDTVALRRSGKPKKLDFLIQCEKFNVEFYPNGAPKEYRSDLVFKTNDQVIMKSPLLVNHPVTVRNITFYQASYGTLAGDTVLLGISKTGEASGESRLEVKKNKPIPLPGGGAEVELLDVRSDFMRLGPAAHIQVKPASGEGVRFWLFREHETIRKRFPEFFERSPRFDHEAFKPYAFSLEKIQSLYYTGLQVNNDPGVSLVWLGCLVMVGGFLVTFFASHRRIWVRVSSQKKGSLKVSIAGKSNKNPVGMERELDRITKKIQEGLGKEAGR